jgi:hypothetical protein
VDADPLEDEVADPDGGGADGGGGDEEGEGAVVVAPGPGRRAVGACGRETDALSADEMNALARIDDADWMVYQVRVSHLRSVLLRSAVFKRILRVVNLVRGGESHQRATRDG